ncbi:MAG: nuclear transport factor 2 family protein [Candidatus Limnocylindria bacterium]
MTPNQELRDLTGEMLRALAGNPDAPIETYFADESGVLAIGSDPDEWWDDYGRIVEVFRGQAEALRGSRVEDSRPSAYADGDVGWVADHPTLRMPDGSAVTFRVTGTAVRRDGAWRFVQWHASIPVGNLEAVGMELPT